MAWKQEIQRFQLIIWFHSIRYKTPSLKRIRKNIATETLIFFFYQYQLYIIFLLLDHSIKYTDKRANKLTRAPINRKARQETSLRKFTDTPGTMTFWATQRSCTTQNTLTVPKQRDILLTMESLKKQTCQCPSICYSAT